MDLRFHSFQPADELSWGAIGMLIVVQDPLGEERIGAAPAPVLIRPDEWTARPLIVDLASGALGSAPTAGRRGVVCPERHQAPLRAHSRRSRYFGGVSWAATQGGAGP
jgi:hypothetical protein